MDKMNTVGPEMQAPSNAPNLVYNGVSVREETTNYPIPIKIELKLFTNRHQNNIRINEGK